MSLDIQIKSFVLSFLYGIFFAFMFNIFYNFLFTKYKVFNIISNMMFSILLFGLYFLLLFNINDGVIHMYFLGCMMISFIIYNKLFVKLRVKLLKTRLN